MELGAPRRFARLFCSAQSAEIVREIFTEIFENEPRDPMAAARRGMRPALRKRFYQAAGVAEGPDGFAVLLDGKPVLTPRRRALAAPTAPLARLIAEEWDAQAQEIDPARMPLTRLANAVIDAVAEAGDAVAAEVAHYLGSDLVCYRAEAPEGLVAAQAAAFDPVLAWAREALGARFVAVAGVMHTPQPPQAIAAARAAIPRDPWRLGAVSSATALTGSALLALMLAHGAREAATIWRIAHVDEDWQRSQWGRDEIALARRDFRKTEFDAATAVLKLTS